MCLKIKAFKNGIFFFSNFILNIAKLIKRDLDCRPLNFEIWKSFKNENERMISKRYLTEDQSKEINRIDNFLFKYINESFRNEKGASVWSKTKNGYTVRLYCSQMKNCRNKWNIKLDLFTGLAQIYLIDHS